MLQMGMFSIILSILVILTQFEVARTTNEGTAYMPGIAVLRCNPLKPESLKELETVFLWQMKDIHEEKVIFEKHKGEVKKDHLHPNYVNRTVELQPNLDLHLHDVTPADEGKYTCVIMNKTGWSQVYHRSEYNLKVIVNESSPDIVLISNDTYHSGSNLKLECSSKLNFPNPEGILWHIFNSSGNYTINGNSTIHKNNVTTVYNITSYLHWHVAENTSVSCEIQSNRNLKSDNLLIVIKSHPPTPAEENNISLIIITAIALIILFSTLFFALFCFCRKKKSKSAPRTRNQDVELAERLRQNGSPTADEPDGR
ncbi:T-lymphocyte activation antigen CD80 [Pelobates fuscus]|uniref:T-lymphocyte activation antigen CD80 n=1 Tax=Pelobates fuscus TaxID=191477 RepID=UPI002FE478B4